MIFLKKKLAERLCDFFVVERMRDLSLKKTLHDFFCAERLHDFSIKLNFDFFERFCISFCGKVLLFL